MRIHEVLSELTFHGSPCTKDCSGHKAGYEWSKRRGKAATCDSTNGSFNNGCEIAKTGKVLPKVRDERGKFAAIKPRPSV